MSAEPTGMGNPTNGRLRYLVPTVGQSLFLMVFLFLSFHKGTILLNDADTGYHVRAGEYILKTFSVPSRDIFSFLSPSPEWTAHEWLSEAAMALIHRAFGLTGVVLFFIFLISVTYPLLFRMLRACRGNILADILIISLVIVSSALHWLARPHIFSMVILVGWYRILETFQRDSKNHLYLLPPLMLLWVNLHGGFIAGFLLLAVYFFGNGISLVFSPADGKEQARGKARMLGLTLLACLLASLINPYGYHILTFPFRLVSDSVIMDNVNEWLSPDFHRVMPFKYLVFLMIAILAVSRTQLDIIEISLLLIFLNMALYSVRYVPLFCIVAAPILARQAGVLLDPKEGPRFPTFRQEAGNIARIDAWAKGYPWGIAAVILVTGISAAGKLEFRFDGMKKPVAAVEFLKKENVPGNMFNNDEFGDYLIYAAFPQYRVFIDGRSDMYGAERVKEYLKVAGLGAGWEKVLEKYRVGWIFFDADSALSRTLYEKKGWRLVYADHVANIFVKESAEYRDLIGKYGNAAPVTNDEKEADIR